MDILHLLYINNEQYQNPLTHIASRVGGYKVSSLLVCHVTVMYKCHVMLVLLNDIKNI